MPDRFALSGHAWVEAPAPGDEVLRRVAGQYLVRRGKRRPATPEPIPEPAPIPPPGAWRTLGKLLPDELPVAEVGDFDPSVFVEGLVEDARASDAGLRILFDVAARATSALNQLARENPDRAKTVAAKRLTWPAMIGAGPQFARTPAKLAAQIGLSTRAPVATDASARWKFDAVAVCVAGLIAYIEKARNTPGHRLRKLPELTKSSADRWADAGVCFLRRSYPDGIIHRLAEFRRMVSSPSKRLSPGKLRHSLFEILRARFRAMAPP